MRGTVTVPFVDTARGLYLPAGIEIDVPADRVAELSRWMTFPEQPAPEPEQKKARKSTKKARKG